MYSGKSTELIRRISRYNKATNLNCLVINHNFDTRDDGGYILTHNNYKLNAYKIDSLMNLIITDNFKESEVIAIDEAQFFNDLYKFIEYNHFNTNKKIIICGLDGDHKQKPFGEILKCIPLCNKIEKLTSLCMSCKIGSEDKYISVCRKCLNQN
jgi:thymidine kinase